MAVHLVAQEFEPCRPDPVQGANLPAGPIRRQAQNRSASSASSVAEDCLGCPAAW
jgi:hypothetical protein